MAVTVPLASSTRRANCPPRLIAMPAGGCATAAGRRWGDVVAVYGCTLLSRRGREMSALLSATRTRRLA